MISDYSNGPEATVRVLEHNGLDLSGAFALKAGMDPFISKVDPRNSYTNDFGAAAGGYTMGRQETAKLLTGLDLSSPNCIALKSGAERFMADPTNAAKPATPAADVPFNRAPV